MNRCYNCGSDKHLVKYCLVPVRAAKNPENTRVNRMQVVSDAGNQIIGQETIETEVKLVMKGGIQTEILLGDGIQREVVEMEESRILKKSLLQYVEVAIGGLEGRSQ